MKNEENILLILKDVLVTMGRMEGKTDKGFESTNSHLATLNSKVAKHEGQLQHIAVEDTRFEQALKTLIDSNKVEKTTKDKWVDRLLVIGLNGLVFLITLLLIKGGILNLEKTPNTKAEIQTKAIEMTAEAQKLEAKLQNI